MNNVIYHLIMNAGSAILKILTKVQQFVANVVAFCGRKVAPELAHHNETLYSQLADLNELKIMQEMVRIQEQAIAEEDWDEDMHERMNILANILAGNHGWNKNQIDTYISRLVESGPEGYSYEPSSEDFD